MTNNNPMLDEVFWEYFANRDSDLYGIVLDGLGVPKDTWNMVNGKQTGFCRDSFNDWLFDFCKKPQSVEQGLSEIEVGLSKLKKRSDNAKQKRRNPRETNSPRC